MVLNSKNGLVGTKRRPLPNEEVFGLLYKRQKTVLTHITPSLSQEGVVAIWMNSLNKMLYSAGLDGKVRVIDPSLMQVQ